MINFVADGTGFFRTSLCLVLAKQQEPYQDLFPKNKNSMNYSN